MGTTAASTGAAGPSEGLRARRSSRRTNLEYPRQADDGTTRPSGAGRHVSPTTGTRSQTNCFVRRGTGRVVHCLIIEHSLLEYKLPLSCWDLSDTEEGASMTLSSQRDVILNQQQKNQQAPSSKTSQVPPTGSSSYLLVQVPFAPRGRPLHDRRPASTSVCVGPWASGPRKEMRYNQQYTTRPVPRRT